MLGRRADRVADRIRRRALRRGYLVDVSRDAREAGFDVPVAVSRRLWTCLVRPYPSAHPSDYLPLAELIKWAAVVVAEHTAGDQSVLFARPPVRTYWMSDSFTLRIQRNFNRHELASVVLLACDEPYTQLRKGSRASLPGTLLVRLSATLGSLSLVSRTCDGELLDRMQRAVWQLVSKSPVAAQAEHYLRRTSAGVPSLFTEEEYRSVLLDTLAELLPLAVVSADEQSAPLVTSLSHHHRVLSSKLSDLTFLTESLLRLAARHESPPGPVRLHPFRPLLDAYVAMQAVLNLESTVVSAAVLASLRLQLSLMEGLVEGPDAETLAALQREFCRIDDPSLGDGVVDLARSLGKVLWQ